jgi:hypothetical protein
LQSCCTRDLDLVNRNIAQERYRIVDGDEQDELIGVGLCAACAHVRVVRSDRESVFYLCELSKIDQRFPKYPRLPVLSCSGYEKDEKSAVPRGADH